MPIYETRRLIRWGRSSTLLLSIPRAWIKRYGLKEKDRVTISETSDGKLLIYPAEYKEEPLEEVAEIDLSKYKDADEVELIIKSKYIQGFDKIILKREGIRFRGLLEVVEDIVNELFGLEVEEVKQDRIVISDIISIRDTDVSFLLRVMTRNVKEGMKLIREFLETKKIDHLEVFDGIYEKVRGYGLRIRRLLMKSLKNPIYMSNLGMEYPDAMTRAFYIRDLENIMDACAQVVKTMRKYGEYEYGDDEVMKFIDDVYSFTGEVLSAFLFLKVKTAMRLKGNFSSLVKKKRELENKMDLLSSMKYMVPIQILLDNLEKVLEYSRDVIDLTLSRV
ncbi:MAG: AbrB/MazE/SpoVT family DNA-binding domain-containing protein [Candidatus Asgardarchaeia archaeon]